MRKDLFQGKTGFNMCPKCSSKDLETKENSIICLSCGFQFYFNAAAATSCIILRDNQILLIERKKDPGKGLLDLPGGFVDYYESLEQGMTRELKEEIGVVPKSLKYFASRPNTYIYREVLYHTVDCFFVGELSESCELVAGDDAAKLLWAKLSDINMDEFAFESVKSVVSEFLKKHTY